MRSLSIALTLLLSVGCAEGMVGPDDIPPGAPELSTFDGVWVSETFGYVIQIDGRLGTVTASNDEGRPVGETILVIQNEDGAVFSGLQVFPTGEVVGVLGRLIEDDVMGDVLRMSGGGASWDLLRTDEAPRQTVSEADIPDGAPTITRFDGEWVGDSVGYAIAIDGRLGAVTWSSVDGIVVEETVLVIQEDEGPRFTGIQLFADGSVGEVLGRLVDADTLRLTSNGASADFFRISNAVPEAEAGTNGSAPAGGLFVLDASMSTDADVGDTLSYQWMQVAGTMVTLSSTTDPVVSFTAPAMPQALTFRVTVTDAAGASDTDEVVVTVTPAT